MEPKSLEVNKARLAAALNRLEKAVDLRITHNPPANKVIEAENYRLEKHLKTINSRYNLLQESAIKAIEDCDDMLKQIDKLIRK